jgi:hypothetical protein
MDYKRKEFLLFHQNNKVFFSVLMNLFLFIFTTPLLGQNIPSYTPSNGLDLWYSFSNNTTDESGNNHNGVPYNLTPTIGRSGQPNTAYQFNGTNSKIKINNPVLGGQSVDEFAFFFLFRLDSLTSSNYSQTLWRKEYPTFDLQIEITISGQLTLEYQSPDTISIIYLPNYTFQIGQWYDLVINFFDSQVDFYINGSPMPVSVFAVPFDSSWPMSTTDVADQCNFIQNSSGVNIGKGINYYFKGAIDEIGVWNRPLIECEIQSLHLSELQCQSPCTEIIYDTILVYDTISVINYTTVTDTLIINTNLGLPSSNYQNTILIYPNPSNDHISIDNGDYIAMNGYSLKIENSAGQQVFQSEINQQQFYIDISSWTGNGLYYIYLMDSQNNIVTIRKIVLQ